jgi:hypothetical protein
LNLDPGLSNVEVYVLPPNTTIVGNETNVGGLWGAAPYAAGTVTSSGVGIPVPFAIPPLAVLPTQIQGFYVTVTSSPPWMNYTNGTNFGGIAASDGNVNVLEGYGVAYAFGGLFGSPTTLSSRVWNGRICYYVGAGGAPPAATHEYQDSTNDGPHQVDINGACGSRLAPATVATTYTLACGSTVPANATLTVNSISGTLFDVVFSTLPTVPVPGGGIPWSLFSPGSTELVNLPTAGLTVPSLNGGLPVNFSPVPGLPVGTPGPVSLSISASFTSAASFACQGVFLDASVVGGVDFSQATDFSATSATGGVVLPGPIVDDGFTQVDIVTAPGCFTAAGVTFYGTQYTNLYVESNGHVRFLSGSGDFTPLVATVLTSTPMVGAWCDMSPNVGGTISVLEAGGPGSGVVEVQFNNVPYFGLAGGNSYSVLFDTNTNEVALTGLQGLAAGAPAGMWLGISPGAPVVTDPGIVNLAALSPGFGDGVGGPIGAGVAAAATDMTYDFNGVGTATSITTNLVNTITFTDDTLGNYVWQSM